MEKPRGIAILTARTVAADTFLLTRSLSGSFSAGSVPIRAPLTLDDSDYSDDSCSVADEHNPATSDASSYSKGLDSGTDAGFESDSEEADDEIELEDVSIGGIEVNRILGEDLGGETADGSDFSGDTVIHRPFAVAGDIDEETSVNYSSFEEETEDSDEVEKVSEADRGSMIAKVVIPRAIISLDDDEFDEILGSDDEEDPLLCVSKAPGDKETEIKDMALQSGEKVVVDEPECSDSFIWEFVSKDEEVVRMNYSDKLDSDEQNLCVPPVGCNNIMVENEGNFVEASMGLDQSFKQLIKKKVVQSTIIKEDDGGSNHEFNTLMKLSDVDGVEDSAVELGEMGMTDKLEYSSSVTCELVSTEEYMDQEKCSHDGVLMGDCKEFLLKSEGNIVDMDRGSDETLSQLVKQVVGQGSVGTESNKRIDDSSSCEADELMIPVGLGSRESVDEDIGNVIDEAKVRGENDCDAGNELEKPECEDKPEMGMNSVSFQMTENLNSVMTKNLEVVVGVDVVVSGCGCPGQKAEQTSENEGDQESKDFDRKLTLSDEDMSPSLSTSFEIADETVETREQISELINKQVSFQSDSEPDHSSLGTEETSLVSVKDVERTTPESSSVISYDVMDNETQIAQQTHNHSSKKVDEYECSCDTMKKRSESTCRNYSEDISSGHNVQLISEKVKERVEKTQLLKEKLQRITRTGFGNENSTITEVVSVSKLSLAGEEDKTSLGLDYVSDGRKITLPEQDGPEDLDLSINVLVIGKTGVGKSATINSIFGETKSPVGAFGVTTKSANHVVGKVGGILVRILDTPGLMSSATEEQFNQKVFMSIKKSMRMFPVDVILYIGRLDEPPDIHLLKIVSTSLGSSVWEKMIVVLTHAASNVPDSSSYKDFVAQRSSVMHKSIRQTVPELSCADQSKMPRIVLAENNNMSSLCGNKTSESTCPNWRLKLLILCCSVKIQSKAGVLEKQNTVVEKTGVLGSQLRSFTLFCSLWNVFLLGSKTENHFHSNDGLEEKKRYLLDSYPEILRDEQIQECLEQQDEGLEERTVLGRVRTRRGRLGFQATKRFGIYLDTPGFSIGSGGCRKNEEEKGRIVVRMSVLGLVPILMSVFTSVYGRKDT